MDNQCESPITDIRIALSKSLDCYDKVSILAEINIIILISIVLKY